MIGATVQRPQQIATFDAFVQARGDALWRGAWLLTGDVQLAEDLVQTALTKAWPKCDRVGADDFEPFVRRVIFTTYASWWRRKWNGEHPAATLPDSATPSADADQRNDLIHALAALPRAPRSGPTWPSSRPSAAGTSKAPTGPTPRRSARG